MDAKTPLFAFLVSVLGSKAQRFDVEDLREHIDHIGDLLDLPDYRTWQGRIIMVGKRLSELDGHLVELSDGRTVEFRVVRRALGSRRAKYGLNVRHPG